METQTRRTSSRWTKSPPWPNAAGSSFNRARSTAGSTASGMTARSVPYSSATSKNAWWRETVELRDDVVAFDSSIIMHPLTRGKLPDTSTLFTTSSSIAKSASTGFARSSQGQHQCPDCGSKDTFTEPRNFNLMMRRKSGRWKTPRRLPICAPRPRKASSSTSKTCIRPRASGRPSASRRSASRSATRSRRATSPSACANSSRRSSNISSPTTARTSSPSTSGSNGARRGIAITASSAERLRFYELTPQERPHYAKAGIDVEYLFPWGWGELESIAHRGTYDLDAHMALSGKDLRYFDEAQDQIHAPADREFGGHGSHHAHVSDRRLRARNERRPNGKETERTVLRFHPRIAPVQVAVFSLARNKPELVERARAIEARLRADRAHAIRQGKHRATLSPSRRDRHAVLRHGRLRNPSRTAA